MNPTLPTALTRPTAGRLIVTGILLLSLLHAAPATAGHAAVQAFPDVRVMVPSVPLVDEEMGQASVAQRDFLHTLSLLPVPPDQLELTEGDPIPLNLEPLSPGLASTIESISMAEDAGLNGYYFIPADPHGAVGPNHLVSVVNSSVRWHTTGGVLQGSMRLGANSSSLVAGSFFEPLNPANSLFDPKVIYDTHAGRFIVVALEKRDTPQVSRILVAASDDSDPNGTWHHLAIDSKVNVSGIDYWADYPSVGVDEEALYITNNMFTWIGSGIGCRLWIVDKAALYSGSPTTAVLHDPYGALGISALNTTSMVAQVYGTPPAGAAGTWLVSYSGLSDGTNEYVGVLRVDNPLTSPGFAYAQVNVGNIDNTSVPLPDAPQPGTGHLLETNDQRALNAVWRANGLYLCAQVTPPSGPDAGQSTAHWWQLSTAVPASPALVNQGNIGGEEIGAGTHTAFPSIAVSGAGEVAVGFSAAGAAVHPGSYYAARGAADPAGTMQPPVAVAAGVDYYYRAFGGPRNRWGDYSATVIDPAGTTFWVFNKYAMSRGTVLPGHPSEDGRWGTRWGSFTFSAPPALTTTLSAPNGGQAWGFGTAHSLTWSASGGTGTITIDLAWSADNGGAWTDIATGLPNSGSHNWIVPATATAQALVRVTARDAAAATASDVSDATFTLADQAAPTVSVTAPAGGATLNSGAATTITWTATDNVSVTSINVEHSTNNGGSWSTVAGGIANSGSTNWTPSVATAQGRIRVTAFDAAGNSQSAQSGAFSVVAPDAGPPSVTVTSPNGGETLSMGNPVAITWSASDDIGVTAIALSYSTNGGSSFTPIASGLAHSGNYIWTVPATATSQARIRVAASDAAGHTAQDDSDADVTIADQAAPTITLGQPAAGSVWQATTTRVITWSASDNVGVTGVTLAWSSDNGGNWTTIASGLANTGSHDWVVPDAPTGQARVRATATDAAGNTTTSTGGAFTISAPPDLTPPAVTLTAPNGGEAWGLASVRNITWSASDNSGVTGITLAWSANGGGTWSTLATNEANDGSWSWTTPAAPTAQGRIRVTARDAAGNSATDESDANFSLVDVTAPTISILSPGNGNSWTAGTVHAISWSAGDNVGITAIAIDFSSSNGSAWTPVASGEINDGNYSWTVPNTPTAQARIRLTAVDAAGNSGTGQSGLFTITAAPDVTPPTVTVVGPDGGEELAMGAHVAVTWNATDNQGVASILIDFSSNGGGIWSTLASGEPNDGSWDWIVPNVATTQAMLRIVARDAANNSAHDLSDSAFRISDQTAPALEFIDPAEPVSWPPGSVQTLLWSASDNVGVAAIDIAWSEDGGAGWTPVALGEANDGVYGWTVPETDTEVGQLRLTARDAAGNRTEVTSATINVEPIVPIVLASFQALRDGEAVSLRWEVAAEGSRSLFHLHREVDGTARLRLTLRPLGGRLRYEFVDPAPPPGPTAYWLEEIEPSGRVTWYGPARVGEALPATALGLAPASPNPFRAQTRLTYALPAAARVRLSVHDVQGRAVALLVDRFEEAGTHVVAWDGTDDSGPPATPGVYFVSVEALGRVVTRKLVLVR